jgi:hypothetical protein|tara:strand:- start:1153 stop:1524 length:372 start_codon:yes stop_codon:yes gene_type:complete
MKLTELKSIVKTAVREAIQEELKDILLEAVKTPKQVVQEYRPSAPVAAVPTQQPLPTKDKMAMRENIQNVLGNMMPGANGTLNATSANVPLQVTSGDTTSPNGQLPAGNVSPEQIMNLMQGKV